MDYSAITAAVSFADVMTALGTVAVAVAGVLLARRGANIILGFIGRGR